MSPVVLALVVLVAAGCSRGPDDEPVPTVRQLTEELIRTDVATQAAVGDLTPSCPEVPVATAGTTWQCTAMTADQRVVQVDAVVNDLGQIELATSNLITGPALPSFERAAVLALNNEVGSRLEDDDVDCGDRAVVFTAEPVMVCALFDPDTRQTYDVSLTISDIEARQFTLRVADAPRG